mmetsp:Transcript_29012/g.36414  ORF Transcript_29012/g.36414 Transcript_29012/m.36414 type:complete len:86 (-) Transcript_29012:1058-1315(-)
MTTNFHTGAAAFFRQTCWPPFDTFFLGQIQSHRFFFDDFFALVVFSLASDSASSFALSSSKPNRAHADSILLALLSCSGLVMRAS